MSHVGSLGGHPVDFNLACEQRMGQTVAHGLCQLEPVAMAPEQLLMMQM